MSASRTAARSRRQRWCRRCRRITYTNTSQNPDGEIDFRWEFNDGNFGDQGSGGARSAVATTQVQFQGINDAPVNNVPGAQLAVMDADLVFGSAGGNAITITDVDAGAGEIRVTLQVQHGTLTLATTAGLSMITGNGTASIDLNGTLAQVNIALEGLTYRAVADHAGAMRCASAPMTAAIRRRQRDR